MTNRFEFQIVHQNFKEKIAAYFHSRTIRSVDIIIIIIVIERIVFIEIEIDCGLFACEIIAFVRTCKIDVLRLYAEERFIRRSHDCQT